MLRLNASLKLVDRFLWNGCERPELLAGLANALPKIFDLGRLARALVLGDPVIDWMPVWSSALFGLVTLSGSLYAFGRRDY